MDNFSQDELLRYSRQLMVSEFGPTAQTTLKNSSAHIIGAGGLGSAVAVQLAAMGIGRLHLIDHDVIETSNLHRQTAYGTSQVGQAKVDALAARIHAINPHVTVITHKLEVTATTIESLDSADIIIDGSDNFACRFAVNQHCVSHNIPLVSGAAIRQSGQLISFANAGDASPCYQCLFPAEAEQAETCSSAGVLPPVVTIIAAAQAMAAVQLLCKHPCPSLHVLHQFDLRTMRWRQSRVSHDPSCMCSQP